MRNAECGMRSEQHNRLARVAGPAGWHAHGICSVGMLAESGFRHAHATAAWACHPPCEEAETWAWTS